MGIEPAPRPILARPTIAAVGLRAALGLADGDALALEVLS